MINTQTVGKWRATVGSTDNESYGGRTPVVFCSDSDQSAVKWPAITQYHRSTTHTSCTYSNEY